MSIELEVICGKIPHSVQSKIEDKGAYFKTSKDLFFAAYISDDSPDDKERYIWLQEQMKSKFGNEGFSVWVNEDGKDKLYLVIGNSLDELRFKTMIAEFNEWQAQLSAPKVANTNKPREKDITHARHDFNPRRQRMRHHAHAARVEHHGLNLRDIEIRGSVDSKGVINCTIDCTARLSLVQQLMAYPHIHRSHSGNLLQTDSADIILRLLSEGARFKNSPDTKEMLDKIGFVPKAFSARR